MEDINDFFEKEYLKCKDTRQLDYWTPVANIISEYLQLVSTKNISKEDVAKGVGLTVNEIDKFESIEKIPNYDFFSTLAFYLGQKPYASLFGAYSATVHMNYHKSIDELARKLNRDPQRLVSEILEKAIIRELKESKKGDYFERNNQGKTI